jgi:RNA polymerase sigma factor (sigma-70 family)
MSIPPFALRADLPPVDRGNLDPLGGHAASIRRFLTGRMRFSEDDADDMLQDLRLKLWMGGRAFADDAHRLASAMTSARHLAISRCRSEARRRSRHAEHHSRIGRYRHCGGEMIGRHEWAAEAWDAVRERLDFLPDDLRTPLEAHYLGGMPYGEIARRTGLTVPQVRGRVKKAIRALCRSLGEFGP